MRIQMPVDAGKHIYHFTKIETAILYILPSLKLKLASYLESNDPKENKTFGFGEIYTECNEFKKIDIEKSFESYLNKNCKHLCFVSDYTINNKLWRNGFDHPTMWAHYGDNSKGVCLAINKEEFIRENPELLYGRVNYNPCFDFPKINQKEWENNNQKYFENFLRDNKKELFYQKHSHWENEHEFKVIEIGNKEFCSIKNSLKGIYLGANFDKNLNLSLKKSINKNIWIEKIGIIDGRFFSFNLAT